MLPPLGLAYVKKYEGQDPGDIIEISFRVPFVKNWMVIIKESWMSFREYGFVDRGLRVPFGIVYWRHAHRVVARDEDSCFIIDDIEFETSWKAWDYILYPFLWLIFFPRKFLYQKYFRRSHDEQ